MRVIIRSFLTFYSSFIALSLIIDVFCIFIIIKSEMQDESFSHISPVQIMQLKKLIEIERVKKGFLITDHMFRHVAEIADSIFLLDIGKVHLTSTLEDLEYLGYARF